MNNYEYPRPARLGVPRRYTHNTPYGFQSEALSDWDSLKMYQYPVAPFDLSDEINPCIDLIAAMLCRGAQTTEIENVLKYMAVLTHVNDFRINYILAAKELNIDSLYLKYMVKEGNNENDSL